MKLILLALLMFNINAYDNFSAKCNPLWNHQEEEEPLMVVFEFEEMRINVENVRYDCLFFEKEGVLVEHFVCENGMDTLVYIPIERQLIFNNIGFRCIQ